MILLLLAFVIPAQAQQNQGETPTAVIRTEVNWTQIALRSKKGTLEGVSDKDLKVFEDGREVTNFKFDKMPPVYSAIVLGDFHEGEMTFRKRWIRIEEAFDFVHDRRSKTLSTPIGLEIPKDLKETDLFGKVVDKFQENLRVSPSEVTAFIVVTDGLDNLRLNSAAQELVSLAKNGQVIVFSVPFGVINPDQAYFSKLAALTGGAVFPVPRSESVDWRGLFERVYDRLDQYYSVSFPPSDTQSPRWRSIEVALGGNSDDLVYRHGYCPFRFCRIPGGPGFDGPRSSDEAKKIMRGLRLSPPQEGSGMWKSQELVLDPDGQPVFFQDETWSAKVDWRSPYIYVRGISTKPEILKSGKTGLHIKKVQAKIYHPDPKSDFYDVEAALNVVSEQIGEFQIVCGWPQSLLQDQSANECLEATRNLIKWEQ